MFQLADAKPLSAPTQSQVYCLGLSHHTAPVEIRERLSFGAGKAEQALQAQKEAGEIHELAIVSTCNRLEVYAAFEDIPEAVAFERLIRFLEESSAMAAEEFEAYLYRSYAVEGKNDGYRHSELIAFTSCCKAARRRVLSLLSLSKKPKTRDSKVLYFGL